jgi:hypothetical protein
MVGSPLENDEYKRCIADPAAAISSTPTDAVRISEPERGFFMSLSLYFSRRMISLRSRAVSQP